jgi:hypothetical protein
MRCGYCFQTVTRGSDHVHDPKVCASCKRELPATSFQHWPSSADGRRHTCADCSSVQRVGQERTRQQSRQAQRQEENELLRDRGYRWQPTVAAGRKTWQLLDPSGWPVNKRAALSAIHIADHGYDEEPFL